MTRNDIACLIAALSLTAAAAAQTPGTIPPGPPPLPSAAPETDPATDGIPPSTPGDDVRNAGKDDTNAGAGTDEEDSPGASDAGAADDPGDRDDARSGEGDANAARARRNPAADRRAAFDDIDVYAAADPSREIGDVVDAIVDSSGDITHLLVEVEGGDRKDWLTAVPWDVAQGGLDGERLELDRETLQSAPRLSREAIAGRAWAGAVDRHWAAQRNLRTADDGGASTSARGDSGSRAR